MRTNIELDDELLKQAMVSTGATTKRAVVDAALRLLVTMHEREQSIMRLKGKVEWIGDLEEMRRTRVFPPPKQRSKKAKKA